MRARMRRTAAAAIGLVILTLGLAVGVSAAHIGSIRVATGPAVPPAAPALASCATSPGGIRSCDLWAKTGMATLTTGVNVPIWGYAASAGGTPTLPGPTIVALSGETVRIVLHNTLPEPTSLAFPGQDGLVPDQTGVGTGSTKTYEFAATAPGTFLYEAGLTANGARQVGLGLYGALVIRPVAAPLTAYGTGATTFQQEQVLVISEVDPALNAAPTGFDMAAYHPTYWLFNGRAYPDTERIAVAAGLTMLLRYVNAGLENQSVGLLSMHEKVIGLDGAPLAHPTLASAQTIPAGSTLDALLTAPSSAGANVDVVWSAAGHLDNAGATTGGIVDFGGMLAFLDVTPADAEGPTVSGVSASPNPALFSTVLTATASDVGTGGLAVMAAEWSLDSAAPAGSGTPMSAADGAFDAVTEGVTATVNLSLASAGTHSLYVRARDAAGNWGPAASTIVTVDKIFADGFESGTTAAWTSTFATAGNVSVSATAAMVGTWGLQVVLSGNTPGYVQDNTPASETSYHARFYFNPNGTLGGGHTIFVGRNAASTVVLRIETRRQPNGTRQVRFAVRTSGGVVNSSWFTMTNAAHAIEIAWQSATAGSMSLWIDGTLKATLAGNTSTFRVDDVRLGPSTGLHNGNTGTEYFDAFVSSRTLAIGP